MAGEIKSILDRALQNIEEKSLKSFKRKLNETELEGFIKIPLINITDKNAEELVDGICRHYTFQHAPGLIVNLLHEINECQASLDLKEELKRVNERVNKEKLHSVRPLGKRTNYVLPMTSSCQVDQIQGNGYEHQPISSTNSSQSSTTEEQPIKQLEIAARKSLKRGRHATERGSPLPDIPMNPLTVADITHMKEDHQVKPHLYARLLFMHFVPFERCKEWVAEKVNFDGYGGKRAIPKNLLDAIMKEVRNEFGTLKPEEKKEIKNKINCILKNLPKTGWPRQF